VDAELVPDIRAYRGAAQGKEDRYPDSYQQETQEAARNRSDDKYEDREPE
jgi:hypothetical protein